jgi:hypothetical protein
MRLALLALVLVASAGCCTGSHQVIIGLPVTCPSNRLLQEVFAPALGIEPRSQARRPGTEPSKYVCYLTTLKRGFVTTTRVGSDHDICGFEPVIRKSSPRTR